MKQKLTILLSLFLSLAVVSTSADARRYGGLSRGFSKSWSKNSNSTSKTTYIPKKRTHNNFNSQKPVKRKSFLKGAFMGLLAGSLIGSLLSGHGFAGFHIMDFIILFGFLFIGFKVINHLRRSSRQYHEG